jgi:ATP-dependent Lon protease
VRQIARICRKVARSIVTDAYKAKPVATPSKNGKDESLSTVQVTEHGLLKLEEQTEKQVEAEAPEKLAVPEGFNVRIKESSLEEYLGVPKYLTTKNELDPKVGAVMGLAWTSTGGDVLPIEAVLIEGSERLTMTGQLGDVMKESGQAALTYIRAKHKELHVPADFSKRKELHVHLPEGAIPKDGPSAGITLMMAMISAVTGKPVRGDIAMTGEITLRGNVIAIGGLQEKLLAAKRAGIKAVLIPEENRLTLSEIPVAIKDGLNIMPVSHIDQAVPIVFDLKTPAEKLAVKANGKVTVKPAKKVAKPVAKKKRPAKK